MFAVSHDEPWEQAEELTRRIYLKEAPAGVDAVCLKLAAGSPEVIEAMAQALAPKAWAYPDRPYYETIAQINRRKASLRHARAALAAGMKKVMES